MSTGQLIITGPRRSRWLQFRLRTLLIVILVAALGLAWYSRELRRRERIEQAVQLLAVAPSIYTRDYDPIALVRAVNSLYALGKEDAIVALRQFAARYPSHGSSESPHMSLTLVMPLLFDRADPEVEFPWDMNSVLFVRDDIPFRPGSFTLLGQEGDRIDLIDWADARGLLRSSPLRPGDDPLQVTNKAIARRNIDKELGRSPLAIISPNDEVNAKENAMLTLREQGLRCAAHLLGFGDRQLPYLGSRNDPEWSRLETECRRLDIRWSEKKQAYVTTNAAK